MILYDACRAMFGMTDLLRRAQGQSFEDFGLGPQECPYEVVASGAFWRHRDYGKSYSQSVLIGAAPIKRAYICDLGALIVTFCVRASMFIWNGLPAETTSEYGLAEYAESISECVARISCRHSGAKTFLMGHSLGGALAAISAASESDSQRGLVLLGTPVLQT